MLEREEGKGTQWRGDWPKKCLLHPEGEKGSRGALKKTVWQRKLSMTRRRPRDWEKGRIGQTKKEEHGIGSKQRRSGRKRIRDGGIQHELTLGGEKSLLH